MNAIGVDQTTLSKIEGLLQTNNNIVFAIHNSFMQSTMEINRKIVSLTINSGNWRRRQKKFEIFTIFG